MKPTVIDLFCGAGGFSEGFKQAGFEIILGIDKEPKMLAAFRANHPGTEVWERDVLEIDPSELPEADVIIGSPPCQDFSTSNPKRNPKRGMVPVNWMLNVIGKKAPRFWILENVRGLIKHLPMKIRSKLLIATDYGVPQTRVRLFTGNYPLPRPTHSEHPQNTLDGRELKPWVTIRDALVFVDTAGDLAFLSEKQLERINKHRQERGILPAPDDINQPSRTITASESKFTEKNIIIEDPNLNAPATTVQADPRLWPRGHHYLRKKYWRRCTVRELAILQSFPDNYEFVGSISWQRRQVGEAVPPLLARRIAEGIRSSLEV